MEARSDAKTEIEGDFEGPVVNKSHCSDDAACSDFLRGTGMLDAQKLSIERTRSESECIYVRVCRPSSRLVAELQSRVEIWRAARAHFHQLS
jgi:hypothetical protein